MNMKKNQKPLTTPYTVTVRQLIQELPDRWAVQYKEEIKRDKGEKARIYKKLKALDLNTVSPQTVADIIGNDSWTLLSCDQCNAVKIDSVVVVGEMPYYDTSTAHLCYDCCKAAFALISQVNEHDK